MNLIKKSQYFSTNFRYVESQIDAISDVLIFYDDFSRKRWKVSFHQDNNWVKSVIRAEPRLNCDYIVGVVLTNQKTLQQEKIFSIYSNGKKIEWISRSIDHENIID